LTRAREYESAANKTSSEREDKAKKSGAVNGSLREIN
jgi:hypothetical protein